MPDNLIEAFSNYITASMFGSPDTFIEFPKIDTEKYEKASEEEKSQLIEDTINNDPFWGKFFSKIKDKEAYIKMLELTKEIDNQIKDLTIKRWNIIKEWVEN